MSVTVPRLLQFTTWSQARAEHPMHGDHVTNVTHGASPTTWSPGLSLTLWHCALLQPQLGEIIIRPN